MAADGGPKEDVSPSRAASTKRRPEFPSGALSYSTYSPLLTAEDLKRQAEQRKFREQFISRVDATLQNPHNRRRHSAEESPLYAAASVPGGLDFSGYAGRKVYGLRMPDGGRPRGGGGGGRNGEEDEEEDEEDEGIEGRGGKSPARTISITGEILTKNGGGRAAGRTRSAAAGGAREKPAAAPSWARSAAAALDVSSGGRTTHAAPRVNRAAESERSLASAGRAGIATARSVSKSVTRISAPRSSARSVDAG